MIEKIQSKRSKTLVIASAASTLFLILQAAPNALAETMFSFHINNLESGKNVMFTMTNMYTGQVQWHKQYILPSVDDNTIISSLGGFPLGEDVKGCIVDEYTNMASCDSRTMSSNPVDFYVSEP